MIRIRVAAFVVAGLAACANLFGQTTEGPSPATVVAGPNEGVSPHERQALIALYEATDGGHWKRHDGWLGPVGTECSWYGVECDNKSRVFWLELAENSLVGPIPNEIGALKHLQGMIIFNNHLVGPIPESMSQLVSLQDLTLLGNHFSGKLPAPMIHRWLTGSLSIVAEASLLTDVSEIDFESSPSMLLCGRRRMILRADGSTVLFTKRCRNATAADRRTFCELKQGRISWGGFATLATLFEKNGFYSLQPEYWHDVTEGTFESTRVIRNGKTFEVVNYADGGPFELWVIERAIEGVALSTEWQKTSRQSACPRWNDAKAAKHQQPAKAD